MVDRDERKSLHVLVQDNDDRHASHTFATFIIIIGIIANLIFLNVEILPNRASATPKVQPSKNEYISELRFGARIVREKKKRIELCLLNAVMAFRMPKCHNYTFFKYNKIIFSALRPIFVRSHSLSSSLAHLPWNWLQLLLRTLYMLLRPSSTRNVDVDVRSQSVCVWWRLSLSSFSVLLFSRQISSRAHRSEYCRLFMSWNFSVRIGAVMRTFRRQWMNSNGKKMS